MTLVAAFDAGLFLERLQPDAALLRALWTTVYVAVLAQLLGTAFGVVSALAGLSRRAPLRALSGAYVWLIRGTPVLVQIFFVFYGANLLFDVTVFPRELDLGLLTISGAVLAGITALAINEGAYMSEIVRAGIMAIDVGQMEAARAVGMRKRLAMRRIVMPQAARVIVPGLGNEFNNMLKTTSLLYFIGVFELLAHTQAFLSRTFAYPEAYAAVAVWYLVLTTIWTLLQVQMERYLGASERVANEPWYTRLFGIRATPGAYA